MFFFSLNKKGVSFSNRIGSESIPKRLFLIFGSSTVVGQGQGLSVSLMGLTFSNLQITHSRIVGSTYSGTVYLRLEPMTGMILSRTS